MNEQKPDDFLITFMRDYNDALLMLRHVDLGADNPSMQHAQHAMQKAVMSGIASIATSLSLFATRSEAALEQRMKALDEVVEQLKVINGNTAIDDMIVEQPVVLSSVLAGTLGSDDELSTIKGEFKVYAGPNFRQLHTHTYGSARDTDQGTLIQSYAVASVEDLQRAYHGYFEGIKAGIYTAEYVGEEICGGVRKTMQVVFTAGG